MMNNWWKAIKILFATTLVVGVLVACGGVSAPGDGSDSTLPPSGPSKLDPPPAVPSNVCALGEVINVPDANLRGRLENLVRNLPTASDELTCENLALIQQLNIWGGDRNFTTLEGLQYLVGATSISWEEVTFPPGDIMYLAGMTSLKSVVIRDSEPAYVHFAAYLEHLEELNFDGSIVDDLTPLTDHPTLQLLSITGGNITNLDAIGTMPALTTFKIAENPVTELGDLVEATSLKDLKILETDLAEITGLQQLVNLETLHIQGSQIFEGDFSGLPALRELNLARNQFAKVPTLPSYSLQMLVLSNNRLDDLAGIAEPGSIRYLRLISNQIINVQPLAGLTGVIELHLEDNPFRKLDALGDAATTLFNPGSKIFLKNSCALGEDGYLDTINLGAENKLRTHSVHIDTGTAGVPRARLCDEW